jgi:hypothetical protein
MRRQGGTVEPTGCGSALEVMPFTGCSHLQRTDVSARPGSRQPDIGLPSPAIGFSESALDRAQPAMTPRERERLRALARANEVRHARAELKRQLASGHLSAAEVLLEPPLAVLSWPVAKLLLSQPRWGQATCHKFLSHNQIGELKRVGALTDRQRRLLAAQLAGAAPSAPRPSR